MAISFKKNDEELRKAWKAVIDDNNDTNWALFAYEKQSCELCVFNTGCGGLEELIDELNVASIMYAFCRVIDPKTELPKYVLINWQGEGAPLSRKGLCANHINDVSNFFRGAHITINARNEDEADPAYIVQKISMASGTKYSYKQRSDPIEDTAPVGTNYKKIQPHKEINVSERENFWTKQQEEEKRRKLEEKRRREENRVKIEKEERERELKDAKEREIICDRKDEEILKKREAEKNAENAARNELCRRLSLENKDNDEDEEMYVKRKQQELAKERSEETKKLLSQRSVRNARALFEQNTAAGQLSSIKISEQSIEYEPNIASAAPLSPKESDIQRVYASEDSKNEEQIEQEEYVEDEDTEEEEELVEEEVYDVRQISQAMDAMQFGIKYSEPLEDIAEETEEITEGSEDQTTEKIFDDQLDLEKEVFSVLDQGLKARALYDYQAADETEISFDPDDIITHIEQIDEGWWQGMGPNGTYGLFPANYVELITE